MDSLENEFNHSFFETISKTPYHDISGRTLLYCLICLVVLLSGIKIKDFG